MAEVKAEGAEEAPRIPPWRAKAEVAAWRHGPEVEDARDQRRLEAEGAEAWRAWRARGSLAWRACRTRTPPKAEQAAAATATARGE